MKIKSWIALILSVVMMVGVLPLGSVAATGWQSNIAAWDTETSVWKFTNAGLQGAGSSLSNAAFSSQTVVEAGVPFTYEADMALTGRSGALLFGYSDRAQPTAGFAVNIDRTQKKMKFFKFTDSSFTEVYDLSAEEIAQESYHLKIQYDGVSVLRAYLDGTLRIEASGIILPTGYLGVMAHYGEPTFNNVYLRKGDLALKDFEILTDGVTITPQFAPDVSIYAMDIRGGIDTVTLRPVKEEGVEKIFYTLKTREYKEITREQTEVTETITLTSEDFINNYVNMDLLLVSGDFERTITFRINKWFTNEELAAQKYRSQFHVTPQINYMNDPNGMVYDPTDGYWHLHYQYSPQISIGQQSWGHVRSKDLVNWEQMPVSLQVDDLGRMYSGSAISLTEEQAADPHIYDGIFNDNKAGESRLIAFYTNAGVDGKQRQCTAYSKDHGVTWIKYNGGQAIIDNDMSISGNKFGDPKVFRIPEDDEHWYMVTCGLAQMFVSADLIHWEKVQELRYTDGETYEETPSGIIRCECPGMNPVILEGTNETKWIFSGCDGFYVVGNMVKDETTGYYNWIAESRRIDNESNFLTLGGSSKGDTFGKYAGMTFYEDGTGKGRVIGVSFVYDGTVPIDKIHKSYQTLPYEWKLTKNSSGEYVIINAPVEEIDKLHGDLLFSAENRVVAENENILSDTTGILFDMETVIDMGDAEQVGVRVRKGASEEIELVYDALCNKLTVDVSSVRYKRQSGIFSQPLEMKNGKVKLRMIVDQGILEVFGNDGESSISTNALTDLENIGMEFFVRGGTVTVESMMIHDMKSMYSGKTYAENYGTQYSIQSPDSVDLGKQMQVSWASYPYSEMQGYYLDCDVMLNAEETENGVILSPVQAGSYTLLLKNQNDQVVATKDISVGTFETNIARWSATGGIWSINANGLFGEGNGSGNAAFSSLERVPSGAAFTYEAKMELTGRSGALLFGISDTTNPTKDAYAVNIDRQQKVMKFFNFADSSLTKIYSLTDAQLAQPSYNIKITYDGVSELRVYLDGECCISEDHIVLNGGCVGVMAHYGDPAFNKIYLYTNGTDVSVDEFESIKLYENSDVNALMTKLPWSVTVVQNDGIHRLEQITWSVDDFSLQRAGTYVLQGMVSNCDLLASIEVEVQHEWGIEYTVETPATCVAKGVGHKNCTICGQPAEDAIEIPVDPTNHTGNNTVEGKIEATCGKKGYSGDIVCECGTLITAGEETPATGKHTEGEMCVVIAPTATTVGSAEIRCTECGALVKSVEIPALGIASVGGNAYDTLEEALAAASSAAGEGAETVTVSLNANVEVPFVTVDPKVVLDLNGNTLKTEYIIGFSGSAIIDESDDNSGKLLVDKDKVALDSVNGKYLPVYDGDGYVFTTVKLEDRTAFIDAANKVYAFSPVFESFAHKALLTGSENSGVRVVIRLTWEKADNYRAVQDFTYLDERVQKVIGSYDETILNYEYAFSATFDGSEAGQAENVTVSAVIVSDAGVEIASVSTAFTE